MYQYLPYIFIAIFAFLFFGLVFTKDFKEFIKGDTLVFLDENGNRLNEVDSSKYIKNLSLEQKLLYSYANEAMGSPRNSAGSIGLQTKKKRFEYFFTKTFEEKSEKQNSSNKFLIKVDDNGYLDDFSKLTISSILSIPTRTLSLA